MNIKNLYSKISNWITVQRITRRHRFTKYAVGAGLFVGCMAAFFRSSNVSFDVDKLITEVVYFASHMNIPYFMRTSLYMKYADKYGVNLQQMQKDIKQFSNFSQFFTRKIKQRPHLSQNLSNQNTIVSPCDGEILSIEKITKNENIIIKDIKYSLSKLLFAIEDQNLMEKLKFNEKSNLYQIIIYLNPGNYHRFHSPYQIFQRGILNIPGSLKPVNVQSLTAHGGVVYEQNARRVINAYYVTKQNKDKEDKEVEKKRYLGLCMIGALNVGKIFIKEKKNYQKGEEIGYFDLGSTIVMVVEVDPQWKIDKKVGDKVKFGQNICFFQ